MISVGEKLLRQLQTQSASVNQLVNGAKAPSKLKRNNKMNSCDHCEDREAKKTESDKRLESGTNPHLMEPSLLRFHLCCRLVCV